MGIDGVTAVDNAAGAESTQSVQLFFWKSGR